MADRINLRDSPADLSAQKAPVIALEGTIRSYAAVVLELLFHCSWYHATVMVERLATSSFYGDLGNLLLHETKHQLHHHVNALFSLEMVAVDRFWDAETLKTVLRSAKQSCRIPIMLKGSYIAAKIVVKLDKPKG